MEQLRRFDDALADALAVLAPPPPPPAAPAAGAPPPPPPASAGEAQSAEQLAGRAREMIRLQVGLGGWWGVVRPSVVRPSAA